MIYPSWLTAILPYLSVNTNQQKIYNIRHPEYSSCERDWFKWRLVMEGGDVFNEEYIQKFSERESNPDFKDRKKISPTAAFAKASVIEIKNSIFQRIPDITRSGGSKTYIDACEGKNGGVNLKGASMNFFLGHCVIQELLSMRVIGVYVDSPDYGLTLADKQNKHPYLYTYKAEDILSWSRNSNNELDTILLRDYQYVKDPRTGLPIGEIMLYRLLQKTDNGISAIIYNEKDEIIRQTVLLIPKIPIKILEISDSLLKDIANHQIAIGNLASSDLSFCAKANFPMYVEQSDSNNSSAIQAAQQQQTIAPYTPENSLSPDQIPVECKRIEPRVSMEVGTSQGRQYARGLNSPGFIHPSPEPLRASMERQTAWKEEIRELVHLALANIQPKAASADSKKMDNQGLEAGLSYIGFELQQAEREINDIWSMYEGEKTRTTIIYPERWSLKSDEEINKEVQDLEVTRDAVPSLTYQKEITKRMAKVMVGTRVSDDTLQKIYQEIDSAAGVTSDSVTIIADQTAGLVSDKTASLLRGYKEGEADQAAKDHAARAVRILSAQTAGGAPPAVDPAAAGVPSLSTNPQASQQQKIGKPVRGSAQ